MEGSWHEGLLLGLSSFSTLPLDASGPQLLALQNPPFAATSLDHLRALQDGLTAREEFLLTFCLL